MWLATTEVILTSDNPRKKGLHLSGSVMCRQVGEDISAPSALSCGYGFVVNGPELVFSTMGYAKQRPE